MEQKLDSRATMLIQFYNMQTGVRMRTGNLATQELMIRTLDEKFNGSVKDFKEWIRQATDNDRKISLNELCTVAPKMEKKEEAVVTPLPDASISTSVNSAPAEQNVASAMGILEQAVVGLIAKTSADKIESEIMGQVQGMIKSYIEAEYGHIDRKINTIINGQKKELQGVQHEKFETVLKFVANNEPVFLTGAAGTGKNVLCKQVAEALGLKFYFTNAVTQEYKLTGFTDAMGNYQPTQFYKAFKDGGLFMLDEMDASIPEVLVILNAAIANRYFDFPAPIGYVEAHPDFRVIAAGNTVGTGANYEYVGRNQLDAASLDRFATVKIDYSEAIERNVSLGNEELLRFCRDFRNAARKAGQSGVIVSYRGIGRLAKMVQIMSKEEAIETCLIKGMEKDDISMIVNTMTVDNEYTKALHHILSRM